MRVVWAARRQEACQLRWEHAALLPRERVDSRGRQYRAWLAGYLGRSRPRASEVGLRPLQPFWAARFFRWPLTYNEYE